MGRKNNNSLFDSKIKAIEQQNTAWGNVANVWCCKKENVEMAEKEGQLFKVQYQRVFIVVQGGS